MTASNSTSVNFMRSLLFVPGNRPERFSKAAASGADIYCIDLEDAVSKGEKETTREVALQHIGELKKDRKSHCFLRINSLVTVDGLRDLLALREISCENGLQPDGIMLPMTSSAFEIRQVVRILGQYSKLQIMPLIETQNGIENLQAIIAESDSVTAVGFGAADYAATLGCEIGWDALLSARSNIIAAASLCGIPCFDGPWFDIKDQAGLRKEIRRVAGLGFRGKLAIHPSQISVINDGFTPSEQDIQWARQVITAFDQSHGDVVTVKGKMVDQPLVQQARRILATAQSK